MSKIMSDRLKQLRKEKGLKQGHKLSQEQAAKDMNMSRTTLAKYENPDTDTDSMRVTELMILAKYYNCDPRYITGDIPCKDKAVSDIHDATGLSELAIEELINNKNFAEGMKQKGFPYRTYEEEIPQFISFLLTAMNGHLIYKHIETGARAKILVRRYEEREPEFEEIIKAIQQQEEFLNDMLNDEKWDTIDVTIPSEQNLIFRKTLCENAESSNRGKIHRMLTDLYDAYADRRIDEECVLLDNEEGLI